MQIFSPSTYSHGLCLLVEHLLHVFGQFLNKLQTIDIFNSDIFFKFFVFLQKETKALLFSKIFILSVDHDFPQQSLHFNNSDYNPVSELDIIMRRVFAVFQAQH